MPRPRRPGSIHEGGELGYAVSHAYGAAFDNPDLIVACVVGDGEAETGPLATAWHSNKFLNPATDGAVLPILHLNGYKIANPTVMARIPREELESLFVGYGYKPYWVEGSDPADVHRQMAGHDGRRRSPRSSAIQHDARENGNTERPRVADDRHEARRRAGPGPKEVDGKKTEDYWRSHQVPMAEMAQKPGAHHAARGLDEELQAGGALRRERQAPRRSCASSRPKATGAWARTRTPTAACSCASCGCPTSATTRSTCRRRARRSARRPATLGEFLRDVTSMNMEHRNFRMFAPDEHASNRLGAIFEVTNRALGRRDATTRTTTSRATAA